MTCTLAIGALRTLASEGLDPAELLRRLNHEIMRTRDSGFITCLCVRISVNGEVSLANAGHVPPYWNGNEVSIEASLPLGLSGDLTYTESCFNMEIDDTFTLLSDGVVEARDRTGELFGFECTQALSSRSANKNK